MSGTPHQPEDRNGRSKREVGKKNLFTTEGASDMPWVPYICT